LLILTIYSSAKTNLLKKYSVLHQTGSFTSENVYFTNKKDGARLAGSLTIPDTKRKLPAVILISGSGLLDRDETVYGQKPFRVLADYLSRRNIAVLRYDDRGTGESKGNLNNITPENFAEDAYAGLKYLKSRDEILIDKIGIIGHSMGAVEGSILASRYNDISFLIMLGGPGLPLDENMLKSDSLNNTRSGQSLAVVNSGQNLLKKMIAEVKKNSDISTTENNLKNIINDWRNSLPEKQRDGIVMLSQEPNRIMGMRWRVNGLRHILVMF
jgi:pimeloyl-ACP methyl ester carboxylesterase